MDRLVVLDQLSSCLKGEPPAGCDWMAVLALANQSLITPQLAAALEPAGEEVPAHVRPFLAEVRRRNGERNRRLRRQLAEAAAVLNADGITPVLLKGAARWASQPPERPFDRLMSDVDLLVAPDEVEPALAALARKGFAVINRYPGPAVHVAAELGRPQDAGCLDLHQRAPGPPGLADTPELARRRRLVEIDGAAALVPDAAAQVLYLVLHDQFHDGDYWRGGFDLRHLTDLAELASPLTPADWAWLRAACDEGLAWPALEAELLAAARLAGAPSPPRAASPRAERTYRRWRRQYADPRLRLPLAVLAAAREWPAVLRHRAADRRGRERVLGAASAPRLGPVRRLERLRKILGVEMGKI